MKPVKLSKISNKSSKIILHFLGSKRRIQVLILILVLSLSGLLYILLSNHQLSADIVPSVFNLSFDKGSFDADVASGIKTPQNSYATLVSPGYGGTGQAAKATNGSTFALKYSSDSGKNFNLENYSLNMKIKLPFSTTGNVGRSVAANGIVYDPNTDLVYILDGGNYRIIKTKMDGSVWETFGGPGTGVGKFSTAGSMSYDPSTQFFYIGDRFTKKIYKTKFGGAGWQSTPELKDSTELGSYGYSPCSIVYNPDDGYIYAIVYDISSNSYLARVKIDGSGWEIISSLPGMTGMLVKGKSGEFYYEAQDDSQFMAGKRTRLVNKINIFTRQISKVYSSTYNMDTWQGLERGSIVYVPTEDSLYLAGLWGVDRGVPLVRPAAEISSIIKLPAPDNYLPCQGSEAGGKFCYPATVGDFQVSSYDASKDAFYMISDGDFPSTPTSNILKQINKSTGQQVGAANVNWQSLYNGLGLIQLFSGGYDGFNISPAGVIYWEMNDENKFQLFSSSPLALTKDTWYDISLDFKNGESVSIRLNGQEIASGPANAFNLPLDARSVVFGFGTNNVIMDDIRLVSYGRPSSAAPIITVHPQSQTVSPGDNALFSCDYYSTGTTSLEWKKNGVIIPGESGKGYGFKVESEDADNIYTCVVTNSEGSVESNPAVLRVPTSPSAPTITKQVQDQTLAVGEIADFYIWTEGNDPITYQWQKNGVDITGETKAYLRFAAQASDDNSHYSVTVSNNYGSVKSFNATLHIITNATPPRIIDPPHNQCITEGQNALFMVEASSTTAVTYQWQKNGADIPGANQSNYNPIVTMADDGAMYTVRITNQAGSVTSPPVTLTVVASQKQHVTLMPGLFGTGWNMVAFPEADASVDKSTLPSTYKIEQFDPSSASYTFPSSMTSGRGYWMKADDPSLIQGKAYLQKDLQSIQQAVAKGWNLLGNPFQTQLPIINLSFVYSDSSTKTFYQAKQAKDILGYVWSYERLDNPKAYRFVAIDPSNYKTSATKQTFISPFRGFWLYIKNANIKSVIMQK